MTAERQRRSGEQRRSDSGAVTLWRAERIEVEGRRVADSRKPAEEKPKPGIRDVFIDTKAARAVERSVQLA